MASFSLGCYTVRVTDKGTGENLPLGGFVRGRDLMSIFHQYLQARVADYSIDDERQKLWRVLQPYAAQIQRSMESWRLANTDTLLIYTTWIQKPFPINGLGPTRR